MPMMLAVDGRVRTTSPLAAKQASLYFKHAIKASRAMRQIRTASSITHQLSSTASSNLVLMNAGSFHRHRKQHFQSLVSLIRTLQRPEMAAGQILHRDLLRVRDIFPGLGKELARLGFAIVALHDQDRALPTLEEPITTVQPLGTKRRRIEVARNSVRDARVGVLLDDARELGVRNGEFSPPKRTAE
jgi:hypothetical protein